MKNFQVLKFCLQVENIYPRKNFMCKNLRVRKKISAEVVKTYAPRRRIAIKSTRGRHMPCDYSFKGEIVRWRAWFLQFASPSALPSLISIAWWHPRGRRHYCHRTMWFLSRKLHSKETSTHSSHRSCPTGKIHSEVLGVQHLNRNSCITYCHSRSE